MGLTMQPQMTYMETRFRGKRTFALYSDRIDVTGKVFLQSDFDVSIPLSELSPNFAKVKVRDGIFFHGLALFVGFLILYGILSSVFHARADNFIVCLIAFLPFTGLILMAATFRKVEFCRFKTHAGLYVLDVARSGREQARYDEFIEKLTEAIRLAQRTAQTNAEAAAV